jgi:hypothetical protein
MDLLGSIQYTRLLLPLLMHLWCSDYKISKDNRSISMRLHNRTCTPDLGPEMSRLGNGIEMSHQDPYGTVNPYGTVKELYHSTLDPKP